MNSTRTPNNRLTFALTTVNLILWVWACGIVHRADGLFSPSVAMAGVAAMLAAWIQYRAALAARCEQKPAGPG